VVWCTNDKDHVIVLRSDKKTGLDLFNLNQILSTLILFIQHHILTNQSIYVLAKCVCICLMMITCTQNMLWIRENKIKTILLLIVSLWDSCYISYKRYKQDAKTCTLLLTCSEIISGVRGCCWIAGNWASGLRDGSWQHLLFNLLEVNGLSSLPRFATWLGARLRLCE
jgi:hypothetical protein